MGCLAMPLIWPSSHIQMQLLPSKVLVDQDVFAISSELDSYSSPKPYTPASDRDVGDPSTLFGGQTLSKGSLEIWIKKYTW